MTCIASSEWPELYHASIDIDPRPVCDDRQGDFGAFRFLSHAKGVTRVFVLCGYQLSEASCVHYESRAQRQWGELVEG